MPQKDGKSCTQKIANCRDELIELQPGRLTYQEDDEGNQWYVCNECDAGFYWDDFELFCKTCAIDNCHICESIYECQTCIEGYYLEYGGETCKEINEYCTLDVEEYQRESIHGTTFLYCNECAADAYFDEKTYECQTCTIIPNCLECLDANTCEVCGSNYILTDQNLCVSPIIDHCSIVNITDGTICD